MKKPVLKTVFLLTMLVTASATNANGFGNFFGGNNNGFGNFFGGNNNNNNCNNWPIWTPMYWMEEMTGSGFSNGFGSSFGNSFGNNSSNNSSNNRNCYNRGYNYGNNNYGNYNGVYSNSYPYSSMIPSPYGASPYLNNPFFSGQQQGYVYRPPSYNSFPQNGFSPFGGNSFNNGFGSPFSSFGGASPFNRFGSPMGMGGFGSPMSMGSMGMSGMNPMNSFGGSPFGGSSFMPFR